MEEKQEKQYVASSKNLITESKGKIILVLFSFSSLPSFFPLSPIKKTLEVLIASESLFVC